MSTDEHLIQSDIADILKALDLPICSMSKSCHLVIQENIIPAILKKKEENA